MEENKQTMENLVNSDAIAPECPTDEESVMTVESEESAAPIAVATEEPVAPVEEPAAPAEEPTAPVAVSPVITPAPQNPAPEKKINRDRWTVADKIQFLTNILKDNKEINFFIN